MKIETLFELKKYLNFVSNNFILDRGVKLVYFRFLWNNSFLKKKKFKNISLQISLFFFSILQPHYLCSYLSLFRLFFLYPYFLLQFFIMWFFSSPQVTMATKDAAERACKDPNPIIDGRKANVNLAYLGAKPSGNSNRYVFVYI